MIIQPQIMVGGAHATCRLIIDPPASGDWNMAVDDALLAAAAKENTVTLRLYQWSEPTLSLGYFQRYADRHRHAASREAAVVRRPTGGGAILHDREVTYSVTLPASQPCARSPERLYRTVHQAIASALARLLGPRGADWTIELRDCGSDLAANEEPFLCLQRVAPGDVLIVPRHQGATWPTWKIIGSAQRRRGAVLQHGSVLLETSRAAPELPGLCDVTGTNLSPQKCVSELASALSRLFGAEREPSSLPRNIQLAAAQLARERYSSHRWTGRR